MIFSCTPASKSNYVRYMKKKNEKKIDLKYPNVDVEVGQKNRLRGPFLKLWVLYHRSVSSCVQIFGWLLMSRCVHMMENAVFFAVELHM